MTPRDANGKPCFACMSLCSVGTVILYSLLFMVFLGLLAGQAVEVRV